MALAADDRRTTTMPAFKDEISPEAVRRLAGIVAGAWPEFPRRKFSAGLAAALEPLELRDRVDEVARRLVATLPGDFDAAAAVVWRMLDDESFDGWITWPVGAWVARAGIDHPDTALPLLAGLTPRWSSEGPVRPFIETHPEITYRYLSRWANDGDEHVRRLVSEGTRPRLPWAPLLRGLVADPSPNLPLLDQLVDDPSEYVRRSVGNHLNDISKDHPDLALELATRWQGRSDGALWAVGHGLRTLVKKGDDRALALLGVDTAVPIALRDLAIEPATIAVGEAATFSFALHHDRPEPADAVIDYRVHYVGAKGEAKAPKVFKLTKRRIQPGRPETVTRTHRFEDVSIRTIHAGRHTIDVQVNGRVLGSVALDVVDGHATGVTVR